jgi:2-oxoglutarate decarboxylase
MTVAVPSTPANYFHLLRQHVLDSVHRPLIVFTPKYTTMSSKAVLSSIADFTEGEFEAVIADQATDPKVVQTVLLTSGKLYYELDSYRHTHHIWDTAIVRVEQLYPFPSKRLEAVLQYYPDATALKWVQEEPANQGAWGFAAQVLPGMVPRFTGITRISRPPLATPSVASLLMHQAEQASVIAEAFAKSAL